MAHVHGAPGLEPRRARNRRRMWVALAINAVMLAAAVVGGVLTHSVALLAEAGHVLSDVGAIAIGLAAARLAAVAPTPERTFGLQRSEILGALANGIVLVAVSVLIIFGAVVRLANPADVAGGGVLALGLVGLAGNVLATLVLASGERSDINLEAVLRHSAADALGSLGVIVAGAVVLATGWDRIDPIVSLLIAALILAGCWRLLKEPVAVLMEAAPPGIEVRDVGRAMCAVPGVAEIHDLHVWSVTSGFPALAAHVVVERGVDRDVARMHVEQMLRDRYDIHHTTLQLVEGDAVSGLIALEDLRDR
jgi:cobalt-zinc-cadmium efflux system protein